MGQEEEVLAFCVQGGTLTDLPLEAALTDVLLKQQFVPQQVLYSDMGTLALPSPSSPVKQSAALNLEETAISNAKSAASSAAMIVARAADKFPWWGNSI